MIELEHIVKSYAEMIATYLKSYILKTALIAFGKLY
jgi:hypothetical protein